MLLNIFLYSFGALILEIVTGKKSSHAYEAEFSQSLASYICFCGSSFYYEHKPKNVGMFFTSHYNEQAWKRQTDGKGREFIDPNVVDAFPKDRPNTSSVVLMLAIKSWYNIEQLNP